VRRLFDETAWSFAFRQDVQDFQDWEIGQNHGWQNYEVKGRASLCSVNFVNFVQPLPVSPVIPVILSKKLMVFRV